VSPAALPQVMRIGQARLTAGLDRFDRLDLAMHEQIFGPMSRLTAAQIIEMAERVDLRGRGGAAFPFARKLRAVATSATARKCPTVVVVNGAEGEPGSLKDRMLLLRTPYLVLSGAFLAHRALGAKKLVVCVPEGGPQAKSVRQAAKAEPNLKRALRVVEVPERFVSGEGGALVNAVNGNLPLPPGRKRLAAESGVDGLPTLLSNAETFAQLAVLALLGPEAYATCGTEDEPGTVLLSVGGSAGQQTVLELPTGVPLGVALDICDAGRGEGVLVGGYHGKWLARDVADTVPVSRAGLSAVGGSLGAGIVLSLVEGTCPLGEVARIGRYLAAESSGQCGPCALGLPSIANSLTALADGSGGMEALDSARRTSGAVRGRGACHHPDGTSRFVLSALEVFTDDLADHVFRGGCGRPVLGTLPLPSVATGSRLTVDWTKCQGHALCARLVPELVHADAQGFPKFLDMPVPAWLKREANEAVAMCPALALRLERAPPQHTVTDMPAVRPPSGPRRAALPPA
jgi:NADH:ubiquinone oxidoreductase subunit F (NADH-binding)/ferredoxin